MQTVGIYDQGWDLRRRKEEPGITVETNLSYLPVNGKQSGLPGGQAFDEEFQVKEGLHIQLKKFLPVYVYLLGEAAMLLQFFTE